MSTPSAERIRMAVSEAVEETRTGTEGGGRLLPFTEAEIQFIRKVVEGALTRALAGGGA